MNYTTESSHLTSYGGNITENINGYTLEPNVNDNVTTLATAVVSSAIHSVQNVIDPTRKYEANVTDGKNITITEAEIHAFVMKMLEFHQNNLNTENESVVCEHYCNGIVKDVFSNYKRMHGYISLVVSKLDNKNTKNK